MKKLLFLLLLLISIPLCAVYFVALPKISDGITNSLSDLGFKTVTINRIKITPYGFIIPTVTLDKEGFSKIERMKVQLKWPNFLLNSEIENLNIHSVKVSSLTQSFKDVLQLQRHDYLSDISNAPIKNLRIDSFIWDTKTPKGDLRFSGKARIREDENGEKKLDASLTSRQHQLSFDSQWSGVFSEDNNSVLNVDVVALRVNYGPILISRGNGWFSYEIKDKKPNISGQIEAGRGRIFNVPANNLSLLIGKGDGYIPFIFRARASGVSDVRFTTDLHWSQEEEKESFVATLKMANLSDFLTYLKRNRLINNIEEKQQSGFDETEVSLTYLADRRFADGPIPFETKITDDSGDVLEGTFLVYPENFDVRGTAKAKERYLDLLTALLTLSDENIVDDTIRLDGNLQSLFLDDQG